MFRAHLKNAEELKGAIKDLVKQNLILFRTLGLLDPLESSVFYQREPQGENYFLNVSDLLRQGFGDCEDLAAWLIAYLLAEGYQARPLLLPQPSKKLFHVSVEYKDDFGTWREIDPSRLKGM